MPAAAGAGTGRRQDRVRVSVRVAGTQVGEPASVSWGEAAGAASSRPGHHCRGHRCLNQEPRPVWECWSCLLSQWVNRQERLPRGSEGLGPSGPSATTPRNPDPCRMWTGNTAGQRGHEARPLLGRRMHTFPVPITGQPQPWPPCKPGSADSGGGSWPRGEAGGQCSLFSHLRAEAGHLEGRWGTKKA